MNQNRYNTILKVLFITLFSNMTTLSFGQKITGHVKVNGENSACNVLLLNAIDSTLIYGNFFLDGKFELANETSETILLKLSGLSFRDTMICIGSSNEAVQLGVINVKPVLLSGITVTAKVPTLKIKGSKYVVNVKETTLSEAGTVEDVLRRTPGIIESADRGFKVIGKGTPAIYIDGRKVINKEELELVNSSDIKKLIVDKRPSVVYEGNTNAVINIYTSKNAEERFGGQFSNDLYVKREISDKAMFSVSLKKGIFSSQLAYSGHYSKEKLYESSYLNNYQSYYVLKNSSDYTTTNNGFSNAFYVRSNLDLSKKSMLGFQYMGKFLNLEENTNKKQTIEKVNLTEKHIIQQAESDPQLHSFSTNYKYFVSDKSDLFITLDYAIRNGEKDENFNETNLNSGTILNTSVKSQSRYKIYTGAVNYNFSTVAKITSTIGANYSNIYNRYKTTSSNTDFNNYTTLKDEILGLFFKGQKTFKNSELNFGLRYETASTNVESVTDTTWKFSDLLASADFAYFPNDKFEFISGYSKKISRPSFRELDPTIHYYDSLTYISGNPYVRPTYINDYYFEVVYLGDYALSITYSNLKNQRVQTLLSSNDNPDLTLMYPINIKNSREFAIELSASKTIKKMSVNAITGIQFPKVEIPYLNETIVNDKPSWSLSLNGEYNIKALFTIYSSFSYNSSAYYDLTHQLSYNNLRVGIIGKYFDDKLSITLEGFDLLNGSNWNNWDEKYLNIESGSRGDYDSRGVKFRIAYKFNSKVNKVNFEQGNREALERVD